MAAKRTSKPQIDSETENKIVEEAPSNQKKGTRKLLIPILFFLVLILMGVGVFVYVAYFKPSQTPLSSDTGQILDDVKKMMVLPDNEIPTIATVTDKSKLSGQAFFKKAENGDKLLIFSSQSEAILYRPSSKKIVNVAPLDTSPGSGVLPEQQKTNESVTPTNVPQPAKTVILNGTGTSGLAAKAQDKLESGSDNIEVTQVGNSANDYKQTIVIDLTGENKTTVDEILKIIGGETSKLPEGETVDEEVDILVILGDDFEE
jgi:hypothetical protein